eukprot:1406643-Karenia_brevis.AAC.1
MSRTDQLNEAEISVMYQAENMWRRVELTIPERWIDPWDVMGPYDLDMECPEYMETLHPAFD